MQASVRPAKLPGGLAYADATKLIDEAWYLETYPDVAAEGLPAKQHFMSVGWAEARLPNPLFDTDWYFSKYPDVEQSGMNPLLHFVQTGWREGRHPHPLFDTAFYIKSNEDVARTGINPLLHYLQFGWREDRRPHPLFDAAWYRERYPDLVDANPFVHFVGQGAKEMRWPNALFDPEWYVRNNPSAASNPLAHFVMHGAAQQISPHPLFDTAFYLKKHADVAAAGINPLVHYLTRGHLEPRDPNPSFDTAWYLKTYPDAVGSLPLTHFILSGASRPTRPPPETPKPRLLSGNCSVNPLLPDILLVAHSVPKDGRLFGAERSFLDMVRSIAKFGCNLNIMVPNGHASYVDLLKPFCARIYVRAYPWWRAGHAIDEAAVDDIRGIIRQTGSILVYTNTIMLREPLIAAKAENVRTAVHCRELISGDEQLCNLIGLLPDEIVKEVRRTADVIVANSKVVASLFFKSEDDLVAPNVVDTETFVSSVRQPGDVIQVGIISSNIKKKGIEDFSEIAQLCVDTPNLEFHVIGPETDTVRNIKTALSEGRIKANLHFDGYVDSPEMAVGGIDVLLCLSHFAESFGRTVAEAMAGEKFVIAYDHGAVSELVKPGRTGYLAPKGDKQEVARMLIDYAAFPEAHEKIRKEAKAFILRQHSPAALDKAYEQLFAKFSIKRSPTRSLPKVAPLAQAAPVAQVVPTSKAARPVETAPASLKRERSTKTKLRIAYFCWHFPVPSETFVLNELRVLHEEGHTLHVFCRQIPHPDFKPDFPISFTRVSSADELARHLTEFRCDVVHGHFVYPTVTDMVWPAAEKANVPFTFIAHAQDIFRYSNDAKNRLSEIALSPLCLKVFTLSRFHRQFLADRGVPDSKILISPNAVDPALFKGRLPNRSGRRSICTVARFVEKKGIEHLIRAAPLLAEHEVDIHIYGYGDLEQSYRKLVDELGARNVLIEGPIGSREDLMKAFSRHDLCICPSVRTTDGDMDGIPTVLLEAMASGLPVMATDVAGIADLVIDGVTGFVTEPTPSAIRDSVRRFYEHSDGFIDRMKSAALEHLHANHNVRRIVNNMVRVWQNQTLTIVLVTWNNLPELREVLRRLLRFTTMPFEISICDNNSEDNVKTYLRTVAANHSNVRVFFNAENAMVGPGTNIAMQSAQSDYVVYLCGKEGFALDYNWEQSFIHALDENPKAALAGTLCYSPTYLKGKDFPQGNSLFEKYRGKEFCLENPDREFHHVQGGLFAMRNAAVKAAGGFSRTVPHNGTDVEFSVFMESQGWELAKAKGMVSIYNKTRPYLEARIDESTRIIHPPTLLELDWIDAVVGRRLHLCTVCGWKGKRFSGELGGHICPQCASTGDDRTLWRFIATETTLTYRRLAGLSVGLSGEMLKVWKQQFQGPSLSFGEIGRMLDETGKLANRTGGLEVAVLMRPSDQPALAQQRLLTECARLLKPGVGKLLIVDTSPDLKLLQVHGFEHMGSSSYSSFACRFGWRGVHDFKRSS
jgi:glycosyltransferase involved in cell wall biosynthesis